MILPAVSLSRTSPPRGGEYLHEVTAGSMNRSSAGARQTPSGCWSRWIPGISGLRVPLRSGPPTHRRCRRLLGPRRRCSSPR
ncbi:hypothetical protein BRC70_02740 [Halobacteriales archaeon QH_6_68_27]|nr:MAG: hypothetical protein BRC70_02740 [Halobacteriales archaeon QH_6_68_27]